MHQYIENLSIKLRRLYSNHGYKLVTVKKFEEYDLYVDNKNFLKEENIITFMGAHGKLLALKPDVTLSIVKNVGDPKDRFEKLYYMDRVYRFSKTNQEYREINQVGVELVGTIDPYSYMEIMMLAIDSLRCVDKPYILDIAHLGFLTGLLEALDIGYYSKKEITECIYAKNTHDLKRVLSALSLTQEIRDKIAQVPLLYGSFDRTLKKAKTLVFNQQMTDALAELEGLYQILERCNCQENITLDFSMVNDIDYYNGIIFQGYVKNLSEVVLTGGQYDNLMKRLGKKQGALGFAINLDALSQFAEDTPYDFDVLIAYDGTADYKSLRAEIEKLTEKGLSVRAEKTLDTYFRCKQKYNFTKNGLEAVK